MDNIQLAPGDNLRLLPEGVDQIEGIALLEIVDNPDLAGFVANLSSCRPERIPARFRLSGISSDCPLSSSKSASATSSRVASGKPSRKSSTGLLPPDV
jgi:hypothetical protein